MLVRAIILISTLLIVPHAYADDRENLAKENRLIEREMLLAKKSNLYFVFDLKGRIKNELVIRIPKSVRLALLPIR